MKADLRFRSGPRGPVYVFRRRGLGQWSRFPALRPVRTTGGTGSGPGPCLPPETPPSDPGHLET